MRHINIFFEFKNYGIDFCYDPDEPFTRFGLIINTPCKQFNII